MALSPDGAGANAFSSDCVCRSHRTLSSVGLSVKNEELHNYYATLGGLTRMIFNIIKVPDFIISSYKSAKAESCDPRNKLSPISL